MPKFNPSFIAAAPALKLLVPLIIGIVVQYNFALATIWITVIGAVGFGCFLVYHFLSIQYRYALAWLSGLGIAGVLFFVGGMLSYTKNIVHQNRWIGKYYQDSCAVLVTLQEPLVTKEKSYKALAKAEAVLQNGTWLPVDGQILLYFKKDSATAKPLLDYGHQLVLTKPLMRVQNAGNPGGFDYARYCAFQNIHYQCFLKPQDYLLQPNKQEKQLKKWLLQTRTNILQILRIYLQNPQQRSIAEALLIGYRDDLDRDLVQSYSNTGVVHIIAISGLHLGMIYGLLLFMFKPFARYKLAQWAKPIVILTVLWGFSLIAGGAPSILRSAVMFTFIVVGACFNRKTNMYNSLAASAFALLLFDPFNLWDVGFQLSYTAVLSIVIFQKAIKNWLYFENKLLQQIWSLTSITLAAQILTLPIVLYHFHQFPTLFLITNLIAVPLSGFILYAELLLLLVAFLPTLAHWVGWMVGSSIQLMNQFIAHIDSLPFAVWAGLQINILQAVLLYACIICVTIWLFKCQPKAFLVGLCFCVLFLGVRCYDFYEKAIQQKLIVYNVPNHTAIDLVQGRQYQFLGDDILMEDGFLRNFHLNPSRVLHRVAPADTLTHFAWNNHVIHCHGKNILVVDEDVHFLPPASKFPVDAIIITKNPKVQLSNLYTSFQCPLYIFDASNPFWKIAYWKKDADSLHLRHHSTATQGAFVLNL